MKAVYVSSKKQKSLRKVSSSRLIDEEQSDYLLTDEDTHNGINEKFRF